MAGPTGVWYATRTGSGGSAPLLDLLVLRCAWNWSWPPALLAPPERSDAPHGDRERARYIRARSRGPEERGVHLSQIPRHEPIAQWYRGTRDTRDAADAESIYRMLEEEIVPLYFDRDTDGVPRHWIQVVKEAIRTAAPIFSARRMVKEYAERMYVPAIIAAERK